jgi:hypothetical protein
LATIYLDQGRSEETEALQLQIIEAEQELLGMEHKKFPDPVLSMGNQAAILNDQKRWKEAE